MSKVHVKTGDKVVVINGKDRGKQGKVLHPNGLSLAVDNIAQESPTAAELGNKDNYSLKFNHKNVKMGLILSN